MKNKMIAIILVLTLTLSMCGCQLALPEGGGAQRDRLIGCFVTTEYLDLFDFESYFNDNAGKLIGGGDVVLDGDTRDYQGRIYAEYYEETHTNDNGESVSTAGYRFSELEGIAYFAPTVFEREGQEYVTFQTGEGLSDVKNHVKSHDTETYFTELSATVYVPIDSENELSGNELSFYMNPVYQTADGSVYLTSGNGMMANSTEPGGLMSTKLSEEYTTTINGEEKTGGGSVEISFEAAYATELLRIIEISAEGEIVKKASLLPEELPESYAPNADTAYIIAESVSYGDDGEEYVERSFIEPDGEHEDIFILVEGESGWLVNDYCEVLWEG